MEFKRLIALVMSTALASASPQSIRLAAQVAAPAVPSQGADQAGPLRVSGTVVQFDRKTPVANACVRLRKLDPDTIVARSTSDQKGAFSFSLSEPGTYVVEAVQCGGEGVRAVSDALAVTQLPLTTLVVLPAKLATAFLTSTAFLVLSAAAAAGITVAAINRGEDGGSGAVMSPER